MAMFRVILVVLVVVILNAATAIGQNYPPFLTEAEQVLVHEFEKIGDQDWQEWRSQQEWRLRQADDEDHATCNRVRYYHPYSDCRAMLLSIRRECAQAGDFFESSCD
jgi:arylamine N-acetyltransferase